MPWISRLLRGARVWARTDAAGALASDGDGRVDVLYKKGGKTYRAAARNLEPDPAAERWSDDEAAPGPSAPPPEPKASAGSPPGESSPAKKASSPSARSTSGAARGTPADAYFIWADGACTGNPGPAGIGVVVLDGTTREERAEYLGSGTNNIAELTAIIRALEHAPTDRTVVLHSDSAYALGLLGKGWKAKANQELVERMRDLARRFSDLRLVKVAGHAGIVENERADALAREAVSTRSTRHHRATRSTSAGSPPAESSSPTPRPSPPPRPPRKPVPSF